MLSVALRTERPATKLKILAGLHVAPRLHPLHNPQKLVEPTTTALMLATLGATAFSVGRRKKKPNAR